MDSLSPNAYQVWDGFMRIRYANENIRRQQDQETFNIREARLRAALTGEMQEQLRQQWLEEDIDMKVIRHSEDIGNIFALFGAGVSLGTGYTPTDQPQVQSQAQVQAQDQGQVQDQAQTQTAAIPVPHGQPTFNLAPKQTITMADIQQTQPISHGMKNSHEYYLLECPVCNREFNSTGSIFAHLNQADSKHHGIMGENKSYAMAVEVCGSLITDATAESVAAHNAARKAIINAKLRVRAAKGRKRQRMNEEH